MQHAESQSIGNPVGSVVRMPLDVGGFQTEQFAVEPNLEVTDGAVLLVFAEYLDPECWITVPAKNLSNLPASSELMQARL